MVMDPSRHIVILTDSLKPGGSERVICEMADHWVDHGQGVTIVSLKDEPPFYKPDERVEMLQLGIARESANFVHGLANTYRRVRTLRRTLRGLNPDVVISFVADVNALTVLAVRGLAVPLIISERNHPRAHRIPFRWRVARRVLYPFADAMVVQTGPVADFYRQWGITPQVISNPLRNGVDQARAPQRMILAVGRLTRQKGFDLLLQAYARSGLFPHWRLVVAGEGQERQRLEDLARSLGVAPAVDMPGLTQHINGYLARASMFVLSSRYEGFPNALAEAMGAGLPCISFNCPYGPGQMIHHRKNGLLVRPEDVASLARSMHELAAFPDWATQLGRQAQKDIHRQLNKDHIMEQWQQLIERVI